MQSIPENARCIACNYPLRSLPNPRCPECGLPFNPADAATMNLGRVPGPIARCLLRRTGWPTLFLTIATTILFLISSGPPHLITPRLADTKYLMEDSRVWKDNLHTSLETAYIAAVILLLSITVFAVFRAISRLIAQRIYSYREKRPRHHALRSILLFLFTTLSIAIILTAWPIRVTRLWTARMSSQLPSVMFSLMPANDCPVELPETDQLVALRIASNSRWQPRRDRIAAVGLFLGKYPKEAMAALKESIVADADPEFRRRRRRHRYPSRPRPDSTQLALDSFSARNRCRSPNQRRQPDSK